MKYFIDDNGDLGFGNDEDTKLQFIQTDRQREDGLSFDSLVGAIEELHSTQGESAIGVIQLKRYVKAKEITKEQAFDIYAGFSNGGYLQ